MNGLSEAEVEEIRAACLDGWTDPAIAVTIARAITPAVEAIVAARLASVKALADKWQAEAQGRSSHAMHVLWDCGDDLAAVLGSDAHTEQKETGR